MRVLSSPGVYTAFPEIDGWTYTTDTGSGILGGGDYPADTDPTKHADDFIAPFGYLDGRLRGTVSGLTDAHLECDEVCTLVPTTPLEAKVNFPWFEPNQTDAENGACDNGFCVVTDAKIVQDGVTTNLVGIAVAKPGFFAYQIRPGAFEIGDSGAQF